MREMTRQAVTKHLAVLEAANLVAAQKRGREKLHYLNPVPIHDIGDAVDRQIRALAPRRARGFENRDSRAAPMTELTTESTVYVTYIATTPEKLWAALTSSAFTRQYFFGRSVESDWNEGSPCDTAHA